MKKLLLPFVGALSIATASTAIAESATVYLKNISNLSDSQPVTIQYQICQIQYDANYAGSVVCGATQALTIGVHDVQMVYVPLQSNDDYYIPSFLSVISASSGNAYSVYRSDQNKYSPVTTCSAEVSPAPNESYALLNFDATGAKVFCSNGGVSKSANPINKPKHK